MGGSSGRYATRYTTVKTKIRFISCVEVFHCETGDWIHQSTSGAPPLGVCGYGCTAVGDTLHFFGGYCNHGDCYHNSIHSLSTSSLHWVELSPTTSEGGAPMRKGFCGTVAFKDGEEDILYVVAGHGPTPSYRQPGAQYEAVGRSCQMQRAAHVLTEYKWVILYIHVSVGTVYQCRGSACVLSLSNHHYHHDRRKNGYCKLVKIIS